MVALPTLLLPAPLAAPLPGILAVALDLSTPALLFPAVSLLLLAYTNRFVTLANLVRELHASQRRDPSAMLAGQIRHLRRRLELIKYMQASGVLSLFVCVLCMGVLFAGWSAAGGVLFGASLALMLVSLGLSVGEIWISIRALNLHLGDMEGRSDDNSNDGNGGGPA